ncbi:MAG: putative colanic acid biosynthesis UDP-glucose lipid carrier transferase [Cyclobacteriaceae bacterium]|jgi:Undecaprenyl-phosphate glucose phosphotransferase
MIRHRYSKYIPTIFLLLDLICFNGAYWSSIFTISNNPDALGLRSIFEFELILSVIWLITFFLTGLNKAYRDVSFFEYLNKISIALIINPIVVLLFWMLTNQSAISREVLLYTYLYFSIGAVSWRAFWYFFIRYSRARGYNIRRVAFLGKHATTDELFNYFKINKSIGYRVSGYLGDDRAVDRIKEELNEQSIDILFIYTPIISEEDIAELVDYAENHLIKIKLLSQFSAISNRSLEVQNYGIIPVLNLNPIPLDSHINQFAKRGFDFLFSLLVMISVLSWLVPLIGLIIKLESSGPIFFRQNRHGRQNRLFLCLKFRTMVVNTDSDTKQATKNDSRITKVGAFLRKSSLDEIPQFINVFFGEMSVVGPRPHPIKLNEKFQPSIEKFWQRHAVKPGITGLAQAKGFRGETTDFSDMSGRVRLDRFYVKKWTMLFDIKIILLTILSIIRGNENAY